MTTKAATEQALGELHNKVAKVMSNALDVVEKQQETYLELGLEDAGVAPAPEVSAPLLGVMIKFLNDNKISCVPEESAGVSELAERLKNKKRRAVGNVVHLDEAK